MEAGSIWVRIGLITTGLEASLAETKQKMVSWRDETNANSRDTLKWARALTFTVGPILAIGYALIHNIQKYGDIARELKKVAYETNTTTQSVQRLQAAQLGLYNTPMYSEEDIQRMDRQKGQLDLLINAATVYIGKWTAQGLWDETSIGGKYLASVLGNVGEAAQDTSKDTEALDKWFKKLGDDAVIAADKVADARQALEDLTRAVEDMKYSTEGERFTQADLGTEYKSLEAELRLAELQTDWGTSGGIVYGNRAKEIRARMERISYEMRGSQMNVRRNTEGLAAARTEQGNQVTVVVLNKTQADVIAEKQNRSRTDAEILADWGAI